MSDYKVSLIEENIARSGCTNVSACAWDACEFDASMEQKADVVIADLPCSGLGIIGRKPDIKYNASMDGIRDLAARMSAQAVGGAVGHNKISIIIPCHRVVGTGGSLTGYAGGIDRKVKLLALEQADMTRLFVPKTGTALL